MTPVPQAPPWPRRALGAAAVLVAAMLIGACSERSRVGADTPIRIGGTVRGPGGAPLADRPVKLGGGISTGDGLLAALTLGLTCTSGSCSGNVFETTTGDAGRFAFDLVGRDTQSTFGAALSQLVSVSAAPAPGQVSGAAASARFKVQATDVTLPDLQLVDPGLVVDPALDVETRWTTTSPGPYELSFETDHPLPVWKVVTGSGSAAVDPRILEDSSGRVVVGAGSVDRIEGSEVALRWRSPGLPYAAGPGPPPSRGRPCHYLDANRADGTDAPTKPPGCALTDGDLTTTASAPSLCSSRPATPGPATTTVACTRAAFAVVELDGPVAAELVVVRGCSGGCVVEVSADGATYRAVGPVSDNYGVVSLDGQPVRSVKVALGPPGGGGLREVSVWGPRPAGSSLRPLSSAESAQVRRGFGAGGAGEDSGLPAAPVVIAVTLLVAALAGSAFAAGRTARRR